MASPKHLEILNKGTQAWNDWREANPDTLPDLTNANLNGKTLSETN